MGQQVLVLGGTGFVGPAVVDAAHERGAEVTVFNRGRGPRPAGAEQRIGDRAAGDLEALRTGEWDVVVDTWSGAPRAVADVVAALRGRVGAYVYVSSGSVYEFPSSAGSDETAPVVVGDPDATTADHYPAAKRGGELAALRHDGPVVLARAGLVLGPRSDVGRLQWWLERIERGGRVAAPGPPELPIQFVDSRDLASWCVEAGSAGVAGAYNVVRPPGEATMAELLGDCVAVTGSDATLVWVEPTVIEEVGVTPWTQLPIWLPPGELHDSLHDLDVGAATDAGLRVRPVRDTVADTWVWLETEGPPTLRPELAHGLPPALEQRLLAA